MSKPQASASSAGRGATGRGGRGAALKRPGIRVAGAAARSRRRKPGRPSQTRQPGLRPGQELQFPTPRPTTPPRSRGGAGHGGGVPESEPRSGRYWQRPATKTLLERAFRRCDGRGRRTTPVGPTPAGLTSIADTRSPRTGWTPPRRCRTAGASAPGGKGPGLAHCETSGASKPLWAEQVLCVRRTTCQSNLVSPTVTPWARAGEVRTKTGSPFATTPASNSSAGLTGLHPVPRHVFGMFSPTARFCSIGDLGCRPPILK